MTAARCGVALPAGAAKNIQMGMRRLPAFPDVPDPLRQLQQAGFGSQTPSPAGPPPDILGADLREAAGKIVGIPSPETPERTPS